MKELDVDCGFINSLNIELSSSVIASTNAKLLKKDHHSRCWFELSYD